MLKDNCTKLHQWIRNCIHSNFTNYFWHIAWPSDIPRNTTATHRFKTRYTNLTVRATKTLEVNGFGSPWQYHVSIIRAVWRFCLKLLRVAIIANELFSEYISFKANCKLYSMERFFNLRSNMNEVDKRCGVIHRSVSMSLFNIKELPPHSFYVLQRQSTPILSRIFEQAYTSVCFSSFIVIYAKMWWKLSKLHAFLSAQLKRSRKTYPNYAPTHTEPYCTRLICKRIHCPTYGLCFQIDSDIKICLTQRYSHSCLERHTCYVVQARSSTPGSALQQRSFKVQFNSIASNSD